MTHNSGLWRDLKDPQSIHQRSWKNPIRIPKDSSATWRTFKRTWRINDAHFRPLKGPQRSTINPTKILKESWKNFDEQLEKLSIKVSWKPSKNLNPPRRLTKATAFDCGRLVNRIDWGWPLVSKVNPHFTRTSQTMKYEIMAEIFPWNNDNNCRLLSDLWIYRRMPISVNSCVTHSSCHRN